MCMKAHHFRRRSNNVLHITAGYSENAYNQVLHKTGRITVEGTEYDPTLDCK